jgi:WXG100 family type VII secretion target
MADQTTTDSALLEQTARKFEGVNAELMGTLDTLKKKVSSLQAGWVGRGANSFQQTMATWAKDQDAINKLLDETAGLIRSAGQSYAATEDNTAGRFGNQGGSTKPLPL